jgi:ATP-dependent 26S proteasome regulatory subunit
VAPLATAAPSAVHASWGQDGSKRVPGFQLPRDKLPSAAFIKVVDAVAAARFDATVPAV